MSLSLLLQETHNWVMLMKWVVGYMGTALVMAGVARVVLRHPSETGLLRRVVYVLVTTLLFVLAVSFWCGVSAETPWAVVVWDALCFGLVFSLVPTVFLWFISQCSRELTERDAVYPPSEAGEEGVQPSKSDWSLLACSLAALSPLVGVAYMVMVGCIAEAGVWEDFLLTGGIIVSIWMGFGVVLSMLLWLLRVSRSYRWLLMGAVLVGMWFAGEFLEVCLMARFPFFTLMALLPSLYLSYCIRRLRCPMENARPFVFRSDFSCAGHAVLPVIGLGLVGVVYGGDEALLIALSPLMCWGMLSLFISAVSHALLSRGLNGTAWRRILFVLIVCLVPSFMAFSTCMCSHGTEFLAYAPAFLPVALLYLALRRWSRAACLAPNSSRG